MSAPRADPMERTGARRAPLLGLAALLAAASVAAAQPPEPLTLKQVVETARENYPTVRASLANVKAAAAGVDLARTAYLPKLDVHTQINRATRNNVFGLILPNAVIPAISGPVQDLSTWTSTFGSAAGLLFSWEPFDFGLRQANVSVADSLRRQAEAGAEVTRYEVMLAAGEAYFQAVAAQQAVEAAQATVDRMEVFSRSVAALVNSELRPGADQSRATAELARARTELIRAQQVEQQARLSVAGWIGRTGQSVALSPRRLVEDLAGTAPAAGAQLSAHPLAEAQTAEIEIARARLHTLEKAYRPKFEVVSALYGRGTGARVDGTFQGGANGLAPVEGNWALGVTMKFPLFDYKENHVRRRIEQFHEEREAARYSAILEELATQVAQAEVALESARKVAANTPLERQAAETLELQTQARYRAALGTVVEVAEAQRLLREAEVNDRLARLGIWQARFRLSAAQGSLDPVLAESAR